MSIKIKKCPAVDTKEELLVAIAMHVNDIQKGCAFIANKIIEAGINHDNTKMTISDVDIFMEERESGILFKDGNWLKSHRNNNRHHFYSSDNCPDDVNLIDVIEALVDCVMAAKARIGQKTNASINPELLAKAFKNTIEMLDNEIIIENE